MLKRFLIVLLVILCVVLALFPALLGGWLVTQSAGDELGAAIFRGLAVAGLCVLATDVLLLIAVLAVGVVGCAVSGPSKPESVEKREAGSES